MAVERSFLYERKPRDVNTRICLLLDILYEEVKKNINKMKIISNLE